MWALHVLQFRDAFPGAGQRLASTVLAPLRMRKSAAEVAALKAAGEAIDRVHANVPNWLKPGLTERQVGAKIAEAIRAEGHVTVDFVIVGSGPNAASPHHEVSDRVIESGDVVVVDIGGPLPSGYYADSTRTYAVGREPAASVRAAYAVLQDAQERAVAAFEALLEAAASSLKATCASFLAYARRHQEIIARFGRFPHRNAALGRATTAAEAAFLQEPRSSF